MTKILILDDHPLYREGVIGALSGHPLRANVVGVSSTNDAIASLDDPTFELAIIDRRLQGEDGLEALRQIGHTHPAVARVLISADSSRESVHAAMRAGAQGFLPKSLSIREMVAAIEEVLHGGVYWPELEPVDLPMHLCEPVSLRERFGSQALTTRQTQALELLGQGKSNAEIACDLGISERTAKAHLKGVFDALGVSTRVRALVRARALGLVK
jgi:DNA-binding NarL/FixJ family response regulator